MDVGSLTLNTNPNLKALLGIFSSSIAAKVPERLMKVLAEGGAQKFRNSSIPNLKQCSPLCYGKVLAGSTWCLVFPWGMASDHTHMYWQRMVLGFDSSFTLTHFPMLASWRNFVTSKVCVLMPFAHGQPLLMANLIFLCGRRWFTQNTFAIY